MSRFFWTLSRKCGKFDNDISGTNTFVNTSISYFKFQKRRVGRISELETQVSQLEDALNTVKDQLIVSESWKTQAKLDAEESRKKILALTLKLDESQKLLARFSSNETHVRPFFEIIFMIWFSLSIYILFFIM